MSFRGTIFPLTCLALDPDEVARSSICFATGSPLVLDGGWTAR